MEENKEIVIDKFDALTQDVKDLVEALKNTPTDLKQVFSGKTDNNGSVNEIGSTLWKIYSKEMSEVTIKSTGVISSPTLGGNVAPTLPSNWLYQSPNEFGLARKICNIVPVNGTAQDFYTTTDLSTYTTAEAASFTGSNFVFSKVTLTPVKFGGSYVFSKDLEQNAVINLQSEAVKGFQKALNAQEDSLLITRIEALPNANSLTASVTGNITASVTSLDVFAQLIATVEGNNGSFENGVFVCNPTVYWYFYQLKKTTGDPMIDFNTATQTLYVYGKPVHKTNKMAGVTTTTSGKVVLAYGDFTKAYFGDRGVYNFETTREATVGSVNTWNEDLVGVKASEKVDIQFIDNNAFSALRLK